MCVFPNIHYVDNFVPLQNGPVDGLPKSPKAMFSLLVNRGIVNQHFLDGINNMEELEARIFELIDHYPENGVPPEVIFHLIEIWGGQAGRGFHIKQPFNWYVVGALYNGIIGDFLNIDHIDDEVLVHAAESVNVFHRALHELGFNGMGIAFITKHTRFWMHRNLPNSMLPIYDSTFSRNVMQVEGGAAFPQLLPYWRGMVAKAEQEHVSLTSLERQLFNYYGQLARQD